MLSVSSSSKALAAVIAVAAFTLPMALMSAVSSVSTPPVVGVAPIRIDRSMSFPAVLAGVVPVTKARLSTVPANPGVHPFMRTTESAVIADSAATGRLSVM